MLGRENIIRGGFEAQGWSVLEIDGHNFKEIDSALNLAKGGDRPTLIIAKTKIGKGALELEGSSEDSRFSTWRGVNKNRAKDKAGFSKVLRAFLFPCKEWFLKFQDSQDCARLGRKTGGKLT